MNCDTDVYYTRFNFDSTSDSNYESFSTYDCPIITQGSKLLLNPEKMVQFLEYYFEWQGEKMMAVKRSDEKVEIYEIEEVNQ